MFVLLKPLGFTQFIVLNDSPQICMFIFSVTRTFLISDASRLKKPGVRTVPRPALPGRTWPCGTAAKQAVLNHVRPCALLRRACVIARLIGARIADLIRARAD